MQRLRNFLLENRSQYLDIGTNASSDEPHSDVLRDKVDAGILAVTKSRRQSIIFIT